MQGNVSKNVGIGGNKNFANALRGTLSGTAVSADDVSPLEHELDIKVIGENIEGVKVKRFGKNLIPYPYGDTTTTKNGVTFTDNGDGTVTLDGTPSSNTSFMILSPVRGCMLHKGVKYVFYGGAGALSPGQYYLTLAYVNVAGDISRVYDNGTAIVATFTPEEDVYLRSIALVVNAGFSFDNVRFSPQLEVGEDATEYEPYKEPIEAISDAEGNVKGLMSLAPNMTLTTDNAGALIECNYTKDTNKVIEQLTNAIISLGGNI